MAIDLYLWGTPNGYKPLLMLEELGLPYQAHAIDINKGAQKEPGYLAINPNGKIPALIDHLDDGSQVKIFESGAILIYLAEKTGKLLPPSGQARADALAWLMFQMGGVGPMFGQLGHFRMARPDNEYGVERYGNEVKRLLAVLDQQLAQRPFLAGDYSIADIATHPWVKGVGRLGLSLDPWPAVARWAGAISDRPAAQRTYAWKPPQS